MVVDTDVWRAFGGEYQSVSPCGSYMMVRRDEYGFFVERKNKNANKS